MRRLTVFVLLFAAVTIPARLLAHEKHEHKLMGTVTAVATNQIEVDTTDGAQATLLLSQKTKVLKGKTSVASAEIKVGERVVVTFTEKDGKKTAKQIQLGAADKDAGAPMNEPVGNP